LGREGRSQVSIGTCTHADRRIAPPGAVLRVGLGLLAVACAAPPAAHGQDGEMRFDSECGASLCFAIASGRLDETAPERFAAFIEGLPAYQVLLASDGGNLEAGKRLGRMFRELGLGTVVAGGDNIWDTDLSFATGNGAECLSACAYAFLGGTTRIVPDGNRIGFHQFALASGARLPPALVEGLLSESNQAAGDLVSYIVEMDVDARLFTLASERIGGDMFFPGPEELAEYDVVTPAGFDHFRLEPYGSGVVAASARLKPTGYRDLVTDLVAFCAEATPSLMLTSSVPNGITEDMTLFEAGLRFRDAPDAPLVIDGPRIATWADDTAGHIRFDLTTAEAAQVLGAPLFEAYFDTTGAEGGTYSAKIEMNDMDRRMLEAAFRLCI
jgi:hypothetical protein